MNKNLRECLEYRGDGHLYRKITKGNCKKGTVFGRVKPDGYIQGKLFGSNYYEHRLIWEYHNGPIPEGMRIDHINHIRSDNRIENLRLATIYQNNHNRFINHTSSSGVKCVISRLRETGNNYVGTVRAYGKVFTKYFPYTSDGLVEAENWVKRIRRETHSDFACDGVGNDLYS